MNLSDFMEAIAQLADDVPFLIVAGTGKILHASPGAQMLDGGTLAIEGAKLDVRDGAIFGRWFDKLKREMVRGTKIDVTGRDGDVTTFRFNSMPIPAGDPEIVLMRFDPLEVSLSGVQGLQIRPPVEIPGAVKFFGMWTRSAEMKRLFKTIEQVAEADPTVLIRGESGTGKEHVARALHALSKRSRGPFVAVNCAALAPSLLESELFGHKKGAFTGAVRDHPGLFERASTGTIFLDEIAEMPLDLQSKLLRVLQERTVMPLGSTQPTPVNVRVISATHRGLREAVAKGQFREDLMYRLRVVPLFLPPLRDRRGDIELLLSVFFRAQAEQGRHAFARIHPAAMQAMLDHSWPGNVRELQNVCEYASIVGTGPVLTLHDLPPEFREPRRPAPVPIPTPSSTATTPAAWLATPTTPGENPEMARIREALRIAHGNKGEAAKLLDMHRTTLWRKIRMYGLE